MVGPYDMYIEMKKDTCLASCMQNVT